MCWNYQVSLVTFALVTVISYFLWTRGLPNDRLLAIFVMTYGSMQLFEAMMWLGQPCGWSNRVGSFLACIVLLLHPMALTIGLHVDRNYHLSANVFALLLVVSWLILLYGLLTMWTRRKEYHYCSQPDQNGHLVWDFPNLYLTLIVPFGVVVALWIMRPARFLILVLIYYLGSALLALYVLNARSSAGSVWCWIVAFFAVLMYWLNGTSIQS